MVLVYKAGSFYCIRSDITRGRTGQNVAFGVVNNVEASIMREKWVNFTSLTCKNARVAQFFPLETMGFRSKRRNSVIVAATPPTEDALIATEPLTKQDLIGYLASGYCIFHC
ncbi:glutamate--cysteine ligase, chloroplastic-like [Gossypium raimondii]|uniref:glutamate--cysteine ligase, chloroplastic-like n=1 Tax=Gossypium raimondii TaxID=29730 RepID=UPI00227B78D2|nr:glutamate--cysteine ligase, chloroplastic-like [Gossypium raimondii]